MMAAVRKLAITPLVWKSIMMAGKLASRDFGVLYAHFDLFLRVFWLAWVMGDLVFDNIKYIIQ